MRINPVLRNENRLAVRSIKFTLMIFAYVAILGAATIIYYVALNSDIYVYGLNLQSSLGIYAVMAVAQAVLLMFIVPALNSTAICSEREKQTFDILLSSKLTPLQKIIGKVAASSSKVIVLIISTMPLYAICSLVGGVNFSNIAGLIVFFIINTIFVGSIGVFVSTYVKTSKLSTTLTYGLVLLIYIGIFVLSIAIMYYSVYKTQLNGGIYPDNIKAPIIIYLSPVSGFLYMINEQLGLSYIFGGIISELGISQYTYYISVLVQLVFSVIFICLSAMKLNPLRNKRIFKSKK